MVTANFPFFLKKFLKISCCYCDPLKTNVGVKLYMSSPQDYKVLELARPVIDGKEKQVVINMDIYNEIRTFGATLSFYISK